MPNKTQVYIEATQETYKGDFASKMMFYFNSTTKEFSYFGGENLVSSSDTCRRCYDVARPPTTPPPKADPVPIMNPRPEPQRVVTSESE